MAHLRRRTIRVCTASHGGSPTAAVTIVQGISGFLVPCKGFLLINLKDRNEEGACSQKRPETNRKVRTVSHKQTPQSSYTTCHHCKRSFAHNDILDAPQDTKYRKVSPDRKDSLGNAVENVWSLLSHIVFLVVHMVSYPSGRIAGGKGGSRSGCRVIVRGVLTMGVGEMGGGVPFAQFTPVILLAVAMKDVSCASVPPAGFGRVVGRSLVASVLVVVPVVIVAVTVVTIAVVSVAIVFVIFIVFVILIGRLKGFWVVAGEIRTFAAPVSDFTTVVASSSTSAITFVVSLSLVNEG